MLFIKKNIFTTIVGGGQVGASVAYNLLRRGHRVKLIDSGSISSRPDAQVPWGWRRVSLQAPIKISNNSFHPLPFSDKMINATRGPMLITTTNNNVVNNWQQWIDNYKKTDARIFSPFDAQNLFGLNLDYFKDNKESVNGGVFLCDTQDCIIDYNLLNQNMWKYMIDSPLCEVIENTPVKSIKVNKHTGKAESLVISGCSEEIKIPKDSNVLLSVGNYSDELMSTNNSFLTNCMKLRLPYIINDTPLKDKYNFIGLWNSESTICNFSNGSTKIGCGLQSIFPLSLRMFNPSFLGMLNKEVVQNIHFVSQQNTSKKDSKVVDMSIKELSKILNINESIKKLDTSKILSCTVDCSPSMCPEVDWYLPNVMYVKNLSGSGAVALEEWFHNSIISCLLGSENNRVPSSLLYGFRSYNLQKNNILSYLQHCWYPSKEKYSPIGAVHKSNTS